MDNAERDKLIFETHTLTKQTHAAVFGNGKPGLKTEFERVKGIVYFIVLGIPAIGVLAGIIKAICNG